MDIDVDRTRDEVDRSFERLYRMHRGEVFGASLRELGNVHDAEDVTQAAFADAYRALLHGSWPHSPRAWLLAIAENVRRTRFRAARRRPQEEPADPDGMAATEPSREQADALVAALHSLPAMQREVFVLRELAGLSYAEIGSRLGASVASVQMLLFRARRALRVELEPPAVSSRRPLALWPAWLLQLGSRGDRLFLTPRGAGAVGAAALVLGGSTAGVVELRGEAQRPAPVRVQAAADASHATTTATPTQAAVRRRTTAQSSPVHVTAPSPVATAPAPRAPVSVASVEAPVSVELGVPVAAPADEAPPSAPAAAEPAPVAAAAPATPPAHDPPPAAPLPTLPLPLPAPPTLPPLPLEPPPPPVGLPPLPLPPEPPPLPLPPITVPPVPLPVPVPPLPPPVPPLLP